MRLADPKLSATSRVIHKKALLNYVANARSRAWSKICYDILKKHKNDLNRPLLLAFKYKNKHYPESSLGANKMRVLMPNSVPILEQYKQEFAAHYKTFVDEWVEFLRQYESFINQLLYNVSSIEEALEFFPETMHKSVSNLVFVPCKETKMNTDVYEHFTKLNNELSPKLDFYITMEHLL